jgi:hypothetical protein
MALAPSLRILPRSGRPMDEREGMGAVRGDFVQGRVIPHRKGPARRVTCRPTITPKRNNKKDSLWQRKAEAAE